MSENETNPNPDMPDEANLQDSTPSELDVLKQRADKIGLKYHPSIGVVKLREKIEAQLNGVSNETAPAPVTQDVVTKTQPVDPDSRVGKDYPELTATERKQAMRRDAARLVRVMVSNLNPNKRAWEGEVYTVSNSVVGTHKKFVPFNNDEGWHVPNIIYKHMLERECQIFVNGKDTKGRNIKIPKIIKELSVTLLDPLTDEEIEELAVVQARTRSVV